MNQKGAILNLMNQKGFAPILIVLLIAVLGIGGYSIYTNTYSTPQPSPSPAAVTPAQTGAGETANWKKYRHEYLGVEFSYPSNWYIKELHPDTPNKLFVVLDDDAIPKDWPDDFQPRPIYIYSADCFKNVEGRLYSVACDEAARQTALSLKETILAKTLQITNLSVSEKTGIQTAGTVAPDNMAAGLYTKDTVFSFPRHILVVSFLPIETEDKTLEQVYDQILSTFKFTQ